MTNDPLANALGVDYGTKKVGLAICSLEAKLPRPFKTLINSENLSKELLDIVNQESIKYVVVGIPRNLEGNKTEQTRMTEEFVNSLKRLVDVPVYTKDEALTSVLAEEELLKRNQNYEKSDVDSLAASYILGDWLKEDYKEINV